MHETLKELSAELAVLHESLERAEAVERQIGVYWREFEAERDQLRAQLETASGNARHYADRCTALEVEVEQLKTSTACRAVLSAAASAQQMAKERDAATARAEAVESTTVGLRRALEEAEKQFDMAGYWGARNNCRAALAASPDDHARRIKAETLRATAKELETLRDHIQTEIGPDDARDDIRRVCLNRAKDLREEADRLEAANG